MPGIITPVVSANEGDRITQLKAALFGDVRFSCLRVAVDLPSDIRFTSGDRVLDVELKVPLDYVQSVLNGHLMEQVLSVREGGTQGCVVILGERDDIYAAIRDSSTGRGYKKSEVGRIISATHARCKSFRKRSMLNGVPVFFKGDDSGFFDGPDQWKDILELAVDFLTGGDMLGFRMRPADGERELAAASMLFHGDKIGPGVLSPVLAEYALRLVPRAKDATPIKDLPGIGAKRSAIIEGMVIR